MTRGRKCLRCGEDMRPSHLTRHINRKFKVCDPILSNTSYEDMKTDYDRYYRRIVLKEKEYKCAACGRGYAYPQSRNHHQKECEFYQAKLEAEVLRQQLEVLRAEQLASITVNAETINNTDTVNNIGSLTNNINNGTVNNNNVNQHLNLAPFGKECYDHITPQEWREFAFDTYGGFDRLMERVFKGNPKNLNVRVRNTNKTYAEAWIPPNWETMDIKDITQDTVTNCVNKFQDYVEDNPGIIPPSSVAKMDKTLGNILRDKKMITEKMKKARMIFENPTFRKHVESNYKELTDGSTINEHIV